MVPFFCILHTAPFPSFGYSTSLSNDAAVAKKYAGVAIYIENRLKSVLDNQLIALEALINLR